jgi:LysR family transcriptional regulator, flagellar master operon regulator
VGLSPRYHASLRIGGRIALWDGFLPEWVGWMRRQSTDVMIRSEIGFDDDLMRRIVEGTLDIGLMYTPSHSPGLVVEHLFDERLVLLSTLTDDTGPGDDYIYIEWGAAFYAQHVQNYPDLEQPPQVANIGWLGVQIALRNGGSCFLPQRMAMPLVDAGQMYRIHNSPEFLIPVYMVYSRNMNSRVLEKAIEGLRFIASRERDQ